MLFSSLVTVSARHDAIQSAIDRRLGQTCKAQKYRFYVNMLDLSVFLSVGMMMACDGTSYHPSCSVMIIAGT